MQGHELHHKPIFCRQFLLKACSAQQGVRLRLGCCTGAPVDLVQIVTGYAEAGNALVTGGVNKIIFVGSTGVGKAVMQVTCQWHAADMQPAS
jgi:acyl-CoA reductase-like NAD-dependent aldehyde dehydrogenase